MKNFTMNGRLWTVVFVNPTSSYLIDRTGNYTVATTDPSAHMIYISDDLTGDFLIRVLIHELGHCTMVSYGLIEDIHRMSYPEYWIEIEEWVCNFLADYGFEIFTAAYEVLGDSAITVVPYELEKFIKRGT